MTIQKSLLTASLLLCFAVSLFAQSSKSSASKNEDAKKSEDEVKTIEELTKKCKKYDGLFTVYQDTTNGKVFIQVNKVQLDKEFIHFSQVIDAPVDAGWLFRGAYGRGKIFTISRRFDKIEIRLQNTSFYFDPDHPLKRAEQANINHPVIYSEKIAAVNKERTTFLFEAEKLLLAESFEQIKPSPDPKEKPGEQFKLGNLNSEKSKFLRIKNYPKNTDFHVELVYEEPYPINYGGVEVTDPRFVSIKINNVFIQVPQNDFKPRYDDPRVGYFTEQVTDMTTTKVIPYRDLINRWYLKKKDPTAELSEPVEPIVWWIENTTPKELRPWVRDGVLQWNRAFEKAGFKNAIVVKEQPDDADWDADDIRYNVLRWTSSPQPPFGGYGPSFVNPRTGQILGADVMLEFAVLRWLTHDSKIYEGAGMHYPATEKAEPGKFCAVAFHLQRSLMAGRHFITTLDRGDAEERKLVQQAINWLALHEIGHTLGLNHNMKSSNLHDPVKIHDEALTREIGLTGSVMDYPNVNVSLDKEKQGLYYGVVPGPYDNWAIRYGYLELVPLESGHNALTEILVESSDPANMFGNDADDMRAPGRGIDPRVMIDDMSSDPVAYAVERMQLVNRTMPKLKDKFVKPGESYQALHNAYYSLTWETWISLRIISRQIGGVYVDRSMAGQFKAEAPFRPVSYQKQKEAMRYLAQYGFSPDAMRVPSDLYTMLLSQRRGFNHWGKNEDPKIHNLILGIHREVLDHLLHKNTLQRLIDSELYGNQYKLAEYMTDLTNAVYKDDLGKTVSTVRQNLQTEYVKRLAEIADHRSDYNHVSKAMVHAELVRVKKSLLKTVSPDALTKAHRDYVVFIINKALDIKS